jgi:S-DNA-T family DNA segregation ATPase FtsK/SpoIIIE
LEAKKTQTKKTYRRKSSVSADTKENTNNFKNEIVGIIIFAIGLLVMFSLYYKESIGTSGEFIHKVLGGFFGAPALVLPVLLISFSLMLIFDVKKEILRHRLFHTGILFVLSCALIQTAFYKASDYETSTLVKSVGDFWANGILFEGGGIIGGILSTPLLKLFKIPGTIIIITTTALIDIMLLTELSVKDFLKTRISMWLQKLKRKKQTKQRKSSI